MSPKNNWMASRTYKVRRINHDRWKRIIVALEAPRKLYKSERPLDPDIWKYGCLVRTGAHCNIVPGRDSLEAVCHGLLAIEAFLIAINKQNEIINEDSTPFSLQQNGLFFGPIGQEYRKNIREE